MQKSAQRTGSHEETTVTVRRLQPAIGAEIGGVDLRQPLSQADRTAIRQAWLDHGVIVFRDQMLTREQHVAFGAAFGDFFMPRVEDNKRPENPEIHFVTNDGKSKAGAADIWHADMTCFPEPSMGSILRAVQIPSLGGDTAFASARAAYAGLSDEVKARIENLTAIHDAMKTLALRHPEQAEAMRAQFPPVEHPVVRIHPETGERILFVNEGFTREIVGLDPAEGAALLRHLLDQLQRPEYQMRFQWRLGSIAFWDNRAVQHYAITDYDEPRHMESVVLKGDRPVGPPH